MQAVRTALLTSRLPGLCTVRRADSIPSSRPYHFGSESFLKRPFYQSKPSGFSSSIKRREVPRMITAMTIDSTLVPLNLNQMFFRQLFDRESCTYTYILADMASEENAAVIIDPVDTMADRDTKMIKELGLKLVYCMNTHVHADHVTGTGILKNTFPFCQSVISVYSKAQADVKVKDGDVIKFGSCSLEVRYTPGHTNGCVTFVTCAGGPNPSPQLAFTGDACFVRGCGRTDFQGGSAETLYDSIHSRLFTLPDTTHIFPAHDYNGRTHTTVGEEKLFNPRLSKPKEEFVEIMAKLGLPFPKMLNVANPANMACGFPDEPIVQS